MTQLLLNPRIAERKMMSEPQAGGSGGRVTRFYALVRLACLVALAWPAVSLGQPIPFPLPRPADRMPANAPVETPAPESGEAAEPAEAPAAAPDLAGSAAAAAEAFAAVPQPVTLTAKITEDSDAIGEGLMWRVFEARANQSGELALAAKSQDATAQLELVPGQYVVHVAYGRAQATDTMEVHEGSNDKSLVLDAGGLRLNAAITGDVAIPINLLRFDIFSSGNEADRTLVSQNVSANDILTLNAGTYHVVSYFGEVNAVVRADLRVEAGELTDATLYHRAAQVSFKLVTQAGGEAVADVEWTVKTASGETVFSNIGAFPATVLGEGDYLVLAKQGETVYSREFSVQPGQAREIEVLTTVY